MGLFDDFFGGLTGQQAIPQQTIIPTSELLAQAGGILPQLAGSEVAYNAALAPGLTNIGLGVEQQIAPGTFGLRESAINRLQSNLDLGYRLPAELQDLVTTNALQQLGTSGVGASDIGKLFGARSIAGAGLDFQNQNLSNAVNASQYKPYFTPRQPFGDTPGLTVAQDLRRVQAAKDQYANLTEDIRQKNFASLINTGGRILGTAAGSFFPGGAAIGGAIGGSLFSGSRVAGQQQPQQGGGNILSGLFGMFGGGGNAGSPVGGGIGGGRSFYNL